MRIILRPLRRYADFSGRASRSEYWLFGLFQTILFVGLVALLVMSTVGIRENPAGAAGGILIGLGLIIVAALGLFIPNLALLARRMHDINLSAWFLGLLLPGYLAQASNMTAIGKVFQASALGASQDIVNQAIMSSMATTGALTMIAMVCHLGLFIIVMIPGNKGPNRYGDDPNGGSGPGWSPSPKATQKPAFDEARIDAAIADLKAEKPYKPVFDFGPGSEDKPMIATRQATIDPAPVRQTSAPSPAAKSFGRRR